MRFHQQAQKRQRRLFFEPLEERRLLAPVAVDDGYFMIQYAERLALVAPGVLHNDKGGAQSASILGQASHGTVDLKSSGSFTYVPSPFNYFGLDSFTYKASDGTGESNVATVVINIIRVQEGFPPNYDDAYETAEDIDLTVSAPGLLVNDPEFPGKPRGLMIITSTAHGAVFLSAGANQVGGFTYFPEPNYHGLVTFTYRVSDDDGNFSNLKTVAINVTAV